MVRGRGRKMGEVGLGCWVISGTGSGGEGRGAGAEGRGGVGREGWEGGERGGERWDGMGKEGECRGAR